MNFSLQRVKRFFAFTENHSASNVTLAAVYCKVVILLRLGWHQANGLYETYRSKVYYLSALSSLLSLAVSTYRQN